jgi:pSer/pThr/pTyr-binding forkhead associated (FHA) protein
MSKYSAEAFLDACGATGPLRLSVEHPGGANQFILNQPFAIVGRDSRADLRVTDSDAARRHFYLQVLCGRLLCLDLTKSSPDGRRLPLHRWVTAGAEVRLSSSAVRLIEAPGPASPPQNWPHVALSITGGATDKADAKFRHPLVLIGQAHECQVRLRDERVSRFHCALVNTTGGLWVVDLLGRGGVTINGALVRTARFDEGDELRIGGAFAIQCRPASTGQQQPPGDAGSAAAGPSAALPQPEALLPALVPTLSELRPMVTLEGAVLPSALAVSDTSMALAFARLQQQMMEQFQLTMTNVIDAFREVHRDQMRIVRQELTRIQQLTDELTALKGQLHEMRTEPTARLRGPAHPATVTPSEIRSPITPSDASVKASDAKPLLPKAGRPSEQTAPSTSTRADVHEWLSGRVDAVQRERDGRWQKIFNLLSGSAPPTR